MYYWLLNDTAINSTFTNTDGNGEEEEEDVEMTLDDLPLLVERPEGYDAQGFGFGMNVDSSNGTSPSLSFVLRDTVCSRRRSFSLSVDLMLIDITRQV